jgi:hypothetical protein
VIEKKCDQCRFWRAVHSGDPPQSWRPTLGECRKRAPKVQAHTDMAPDTVWPRTEPDDFCGDFKRN